MVDCWCLERVISHLGKVTSSDGHLHGSEVKPQHVRRHLHGNHVLQEAGMCQAAACSVEVLTMPTCEGSRAMSLHMMQVFNTGGTSGTASSRASLSSTLRLVKHGFGGIVTVCHSHSSSTCASLKTSRLETSRNRILDDSRSRGQLGIVCQDTNLAVRQRSENRRFITIPCVTCVVSAEQGVIYALRSRKKLVRVMTD